MSNIFEPAIALANILDILDRLKIPNFLVGSFASGFRGEFRATNDLDIVCQFNEKVIEEFISLAKKNFYCDELSIPLAIQANKSFNLIHEKTFVKVDIFTKISDFEAEQFSLATKLKIPSTDKEVNVSTAEYNIVAKLNWYLKSKGVLERQISDVKSMIRINKDSLNMDYLKKWTEFFNTTELFNKVIASPL